MDAQEVMRGLVFAAKIRGAESFEEALEWMLANEYVIEQDGDYFPSAKGTQRAENILNPSRLDAADHRLLYAWARALCDARAKGDETPRFDDTDAVVEWLVGRGHLGDVKEKRCREIVAKGMLTYAPIGGLVAQAEPG